MATRKIETTIALDGEQAFKQALSSAAREMRVLESASRTLDAAYASNGDKASMLASRQQNLQQQLAQQDQIVKALENAMKDAAEAYGEGSSQVDGYAVKLNNARTKQLNLQKSLKQVDREIEEMGRDSTKTGRQLQEGIGEGAQEAEGDVKSLMDTLAGSATIQAVSSAWQLGSNIVGTIGNVVSTVTGFAEETQEFRREMSLLELAAQTHNFDFTTLTEAMTNVASITGDASGSIKGLIQLVNTGMTEYQLQRATEGLLGATLKYPNLEFNSLAEGFAETIATGEASGSFAELIKQLGVDVEKFNTALKESPTIAGDVEAALAQLAAGGLNELTKEYQEANTTLTEAQRLKAELEAENAELGGYIEKYVTVPAQKLELEFKSLLNDSIALAESEGIGAGVSHFVDEWFSTPQETVEKYGSIIKDMVPEEDIETAKRKWDLTALMSGVAPEAGDRLAADMTEAGAAAAQNFAAGWEMELDTSLWGEGKESEQLVTIYPIEAMEGMDKDMESAGEGAGEAYVEGMESGMAGGADAAQTAGAEFAAAFGAGINSQVSYVSGAAAAVVAGALAQMQAASARAAGGSAGVINLDGRQVGTVLFPTMSEMMAVDVAP